MKKIVTLFAALMLLSLNLMAEVVDYKLSIAGKNVTSANANDVFGDKTVWYDADNNRLYLSNAEINGPIWYHPSWDIDNKLEIGVLGKSVIALDETNTHGAALYVDYTAHLEIAGWGTEPAELEVRNMKGGSSAAAIRLDHYTGVSSEVSLSHLTLKVTCENHYAIQCDELKVGSMTYLYATGAAKKRAIKCADDKFMLTESKLVYSTKNTTELAAGHKIIIVPEMLVQEYDGIKIKGQKPNNYTLNDVFQNEAGDSWDPVKNVLTLRGSYYPNLDDVTWIDFSVPATIKGEGEDDKTFSCTSNYPVIHTTENLTITSGPALYMSSSGPCAIELEPTANDILLTFDKANIENMAGYAYSIQKTGSSLNKANIAFNLSYVDDMKNVNGINGCNLSGCAFENTGIELEGGKFLDYSDLTACEFGCPEPTMIRIITDAYPVSVTGVDVFPYNMHDVLGDGMVSYDPDTKTLTFKDGVDINSGGGSAVAVQVNDQDLTIVFEGSPVEFLGENYECIVMDATDKKLTIVSALSANNSPIELLSNNNNSVPVIRAVNCDVEFKGVNPFIVASKEDYQDAPIIKAKNLYVNAPLSLNNKNTSSLDDALNVVAIKLGTYIVLDPAMDKLTFNPYSEQVQWKTSSLDKILAVDFIGEALPGDVKLTVVGIKVTRANAKDIIGNGQIIYDEVNKKLTLDNANITVSNGKAVHAQEIGLTKLTIEIKGSNVITCNKSYGFDIETETEFVGVGTNPFLKIDVEDEHSGYKAINIFAEKLTIKNLAIAATVNHAANSALRVGTTFGTLTVDNADLRVAINDLHYPTCAISCEALDPKNGSELRSNEPEWPIITWTGTAFDGTDLSRIWIGKNATFPTDIDELFDPDNKEISTVNSQLSTKILRNGQLYILRNGALYTITGARVE